MSITWSERKNYRSVEILQHTIEYWFGNNFHDGIIVDVMIDFEHIEEMIMGGYREGELLVDDCGTIYRGWWRIKWQ